MKSIDEISTYIKASEFPRTAAIPEVPHTRNLKNLPCALVIRTNEGLTLT